MKFLIRILIVIFSCNIINAAFIKNVGQWENDIQYFGQFNGYNVWIGKNKITFDNYKYFINNKENIKEGFIYNLQFFNSNNFEFQEFNSNKAPLNYIGKNSYTTYQADILKIKNIYNGVDFILYEEDGFLRYDFKLSKYAALDQIKMLFDCNVEIIDNQLLVADGNFKIFHSDLNSYDVESKNNIQIDFIQDNNYIGFTTNSKIENDIIIDPIIFSSYFGGARYDFSRDMVLDDMGNIYITGFTSSHDFPTSAGVYSRTLQRTQWDYPDIFVSKFNPMGDSLIFSTFIGGLGDDYGEGISLDSEGNIYVTGYTWPVEFPVTENAFQDTAQSGYDAFIIKLDSNGSNLIFSTLVGGSKDDYGIAITINDENEAYITGYCTSDGNYPISSNAFLKTSRGKHDSFITQINSDGSDLIFSTYLSGSEDDFGQDILLFPNGKILVCGRTSSSDFLTTPNAFSRDYAEGDTSNAYFSIISANGDQLEYSSFFGGSKEDGAYSVAFDQDFNIYLTGFTESTDLDVSENAYDKILNYDFNLAGNSDAFLAKFNSTGNSLIYSTYFGGSSAERSYSVNIDDNNFAYIAGTTNSSDMELRGKSVDSTIAGLEKTSDAFIAKINPDGSDLSYSTYLGGSFNEVARAISINNDDFSFVVTGMTNSTDFQTYGNNIDSTYNDTLKADIFISRILPSFIHFSLGDDYEICRGDSVFISIEAQGGFGTLSYQWEPELFISQTDSSFAFLFPDSTTTYKLTVRDTANHEEYDFITIEVLPTPEFNLSGPSSSPDSATAIYIVDDFSIIDSVSWSANNGEILNYNLLSAEVKWHNGPTGTIYLTAFAENGCSSTDSILVIIGEKFNFDLNVLQFSDVLCEGDFAILVPDTNYSEYYYSDGTNTRLDTISKTGDYYLIVKNSEGYYGISDTVSVEFIPKPELFVNGNLLCNIDSIYNYQIASQENVSYEYEISGGDIITNSDGLLSIKWTDGPNGYIYIYAENQAGCSDSILFNVLIGNFGKPQLIGVDSNGNLLSGNFDFCSGDTVTLDAGAGYKSYLWNDSTTSRYLKIWESGVYWVDVVDLNDENHFSDTIQIQTLQRPPKPQVTILDTKLRCNTIAKTYQWYLNGNILIGVTERIIEPSQGGYYQVEITANNNCKNISDRIFIDETSVNENNQSNPTIYPNPVKDYMYLNSKSNQYFEIYNLLGELILTGNYNEKIDLHDLYYGIYYIKINDKLFKFIKL